MKVQYQTIELFKNNCSTLKETSHDKDSEVPSYMTNSQIEVVNFDKVVNCYSKELAALNIPCSVDALYFGQEEAIYFIEFKNGTLKKEKVFKVYNKIYDSLLLFNDIVQENISFCREHVYFILVYNESKNLDQINKQTSEDCAKATIGKYFHRKAQKNYVRFGLERFKKIYFRDVFTYTESEFEKIFLASIATK